MHPRVRRRNVLLLLLRRAGLIEIEKAKHSRFHHGGKSPTMVLILFTKKERRIRDDRKSAEKKKETYKQTELGTPPIQVYLGRLEHLLRSARTHNLHYTRIYIIILYDACVLQFPSFFNDTLVPLLPRGNVESRGTRIEQFASKLHRAPNDGAVYICIVIVPLHFSFFVLIFVVSFLKDDGRIAN